jgi:hypothetical protein
VTVHRIPVAWPAKVHPLFVTGKIEEEESPLLDGTIVAIECYRGSVVTFTWMATGGHVYAYLPPHAFSLEPRSFGGFPPVFAAVTRVTDFVCQGDAPSFVRFDAFDQQSSYGFGAIQDGPVVASVAWLRYLGSLDFAASNELVHLTVGPRGAIFVFRNHRFQVGGQSWQPPLDWVKSRADWTI